MSISLDLTKAIDCISYEIFLSKLRFYGFYDNSYQLLRSNLYSRQQFTQINKKKSATKPINSGVPQGSVLGHLLFLLYINDLPNSLCDNTFYLQTIRHLA